MAGLMPIPLSEYKAYCEIFGITDEEEKEELLMILQKVDSEFLSMKKAGKT